MKLTAESLPMRPWHEGLWRQFAAALEMLQRAVEQCPEELWSDPSFPPHWNDTGVVGFWYVVFHTLFWTDCYLFGSEEGFAPPTPFTLDEFDPEGKLPGRPYTKPELLRYLGHCMERCGTMIRRMTEEEAGRTCTLSWER